jgi:hypothetical protein
MALRISPIPELPNEEHRRAIKAFILTQLRESWGYYPGPVLPIYIDGTPRMTRYGNWALDSASLYMGDPPSRGGKMEDFGTRVFVLMALGKVAGLGEDEELLGFFRVAMAKTLAGLIEDSRRILDVITPDDPKKGVNGVAYNPEGKLAVKVEEEWFTAEGEKVEIGEGGWVIGIGIMPDRSETPEDLEDGWDEGDEEDEGEEDEDAET